jgi:hypothetical protein
MEAAQRSKSNLKKKRMKKFLLKKIYTKKTKRNAHRVLFFNTTTTKKISCQATETTATRLCGT